MAAAIRAYNRELRYSLNNLTELQEEHLSRFYYNNVKAASIPAFRLTGLYYENVIMREIFDVRIFARKFLEYVWNFASNERSMIVFGGISRTFVEDFRPYVDEFNGLCYVVREVWSGFFKSSYLLTSTHQHSNPENYKDYRRILFADPIASCDFWQAGLVLLSLGEIYSSTFYLTIPDRSTALRLLNTYGSHLLAIGTNILMMNKDNAFTPNASEDELEMRIRNAIMWTYNSGGNPRPQAGVEFKQQILEQAQQYHYVLSYPYFPIQIDTRFPTVYYYVKKLHNVLENYFRSLRDALDLFIYGMVVTGHALVYYAMLQVGWVAGSRFTKEAGMAMDYIEANIFPEDPVFEKLGNRHFYMNTPMGSTCLRKPEKLNRLRQEGINDIEVFKDVFHHLVYTHKALNYIRGEPWERADKFAATANIFMAALSRAIEAPQANWQFMLDPIEHWIVYQGSLLEDCFHRRIASNSRTRSFIDAACEPYTRPIAQGVVKLSSGHTKLDDIFRYTLPDDTQPISAFGHDEN